MVFAKESITLFRRRSKPGQFARPGFRVPLSKRGRPMANEQLYLAIGLPTLFNAVLFTLLVAYIHAKFDAIDPKFDAVNRSFDDMRDLWRAELHRVQEMLDAGLKHLEEKI